MTTKHSTVITLNAENSELTINNDFLRTFDVFGQPGNGKGRRITGIYVEELDGYEQILKLSTPLLNPQEGDSFNDFNLIFHDRDMCDVTPRLLDGDIEHEQREVTKRNLLDHYYYPFHADKRITIPVSPNGINIMATFRRGELIPRPGLLKLRLEWETNVPLAGEFSVWHRRVGHVKFDENGCLVRII
jgi:hypothetical protein